MFRLSETLPRAFAPVHVNLSTLTVEPDVTSAAPVKAARPFDQAGREERAGDVLASRAIVGYGDDYLVQPADPKAAPYTVSLDGAGSCSCPDARFRVSKARRNGDTSAACKHLVAVRVHVRNAVPVAA